MPAPRRSHIGHRPLVIAGTLLLQLIVATVFSRYLATKIAYEGLLYRGAGLGTMFACVVLGLAPATWMRLRLSRPSDGVIWMLYVLTIIPMSMMLPLNPALTEGAAIKFVAIVVASFAVLTAVPFVGLSPLPRSAWLAHHGWNLLIVSGGLGLAMVIARFGVRLSLLSLANVYDARLSFRTVAAGASPVFAYLIVWLQNLFGPLLFIGGLIRRSAVGVGLGVAAELWVYQTLGNRQALIAVAGCWVVWRLGRVRSERGPSVLLWGSIAIALLSTGADLATGSFLSGYFLVRVLMLPSVLMADYFSYFSLHAPVLLRDGLFSVLGRSPYATATAYTIGFEFFQNPNTSANGNIWADGFANFGYIGMIAVPIVLAFIIWLLDNGTTRAAPGTVAGVLAVTVISLANGGLQTILVTNGFAPLIAFLVLTGGEVLAPDHAVWFSTFRRLAPARHQIPVSRAARPARPSLTSREINTR